MRRKKKLSRRRVALRRIAAAVIMVVLVNHFLGTGLLFPRLAICRMEELAGVGSTAVLARRFPSDRQMYIVYLTANDGALFMGSAEPGAWGWTYDSGMALDTSGSESLYAGWFDGGQTEYLFGCVKDPRIVSVQIEAQDSERYEVKLQEKSGQKFFVLERPEYEGNAAIYAAGYDTAGEKIVRREIVHEAMDAYYIL